MTWDREIVKQKQQRWDTCLNADSAIVVVIEMAIMDIVESHIVNCEEKYI